MPILILRGSFLFLSALMGSSLSCLGPFSRLSLGGGGVGRLV